MTGHDGRNGVLVDQLRMPIATQQHAEIIEPGDHALQLDAVHQEDGERNFGFADVIEEGVLQVLCAVGCHGRCFRFCTAGPCPTGLFFSHLCGRVPPIFRAGRTQEVEPLEGATAGDASPVW